MAGANDFLREFLIGLGFEVNEGSKKKIVDTIAHMSLKAAELAAAMEAAAVAAVAAVAKIADGMERLYFASRRTNASIENIQAFGFAAANMGSSAAAAENSMEGLARFLRSSPGAAGLIQSLGVATQVNGHARDAADILGDLGDRFKSMPVYLAQRYADTFGIDEKTFLAMREGMGRFGAAYKAMVHQAGLDSEQAGRSSHFLMIQLRTLGAALTILRQKIVAELADHVGEQIERLRRFIVDNFGRISEVIDGAIRVLIDIGTTIAQVVAHAAEGITQLANWFSHLNTRTREVIEALGLLLIAWKVLNTGFLATPLGRIFALAGALALLWDDYRTWKEGGRSLIDWGRWLTDARAGIEIIQGLWAQIKAVDWKAWIPDLGALGGSLAQLGASVAELAGQVAKSARAIWDAIGTYVTSYAVEALKGLGDGLKTMVRVIADGIGATAMLLRGDWRGAWADAKDAFAAVAGFIEGRFNSLRDQLLRIVAALARGLSSLTGSMGAAGDSWRASLDAIGQALSVLAGALPGYYRTIADGARKFWDQFGGDVLAWAKVALDGLEGALRTFFRVISDGIGFVAMLLGGDWKGAWNDAKDAFAAVAGFIEDRFTAVRDVIYKIVEDIATKLSWLASPMKAITGAEQGLVGWVKSFLPGAQDAGGGFGTGTPGGRSAPAQASRGAMRDAMKWFMDHGWSMNQAGGIVANLVAESGLNPNAIGDNGQAHGIAQWHADRRRAIEAHFGKSVDDMNLQEQYAAMNWEISHPEAASGAALAQSQGSASTAGALVSQLYERPAHAGYEAMRRGDLATSIVQDFTTHINIAPGPTANDTANRVASVQSRVHADALRNAKARAS